MENKKSPKKLIWKIAKIIIAFLVVIAIFISLCYVAEYAYWGRRHSVLYDVTSVYVKQDDENKNIYHLTYKASVENWKHDRQPHTYKLVSCLGGSIGVDSNFDGESTYFTSSNEKTEFIINAQLDLNMWFENNYEYADRTPTKEDEIKEIKNLIFFSEFAAIDENKIYIDGASLYMSDNTDAEIIFE